MEIKKFKDMLLNKAVEMGFDEAEFFYQSSDSNSITIYKSQVEKTQNNSTGGFSFRGLYKGNMGYYYSETVDESMIDEIINQAIENAEIITSVEKEFIYEGDKKYPELNVYNPELAEISVEDKIKACLAMEKAVFDYDKRVTAVNTATVLVGQGYTYIANTKGLEVSEKSAYLMAYVNCMAEENGVIKTNGEIFLGRAWNEFDPIKIGTMAAKKTIDSLNSHTVKSNKYKIIMENQCFADLMGCYTGNFYGENVIKGFSLLAHKLDKKIANDNITIVDEPLLDGGYSTTAFDCEGVASYNKTIIEKGVLKGFLHNLKSANAMGVKPTGNGFKASFKGTVGISETNFYLKAGNISFDEMVEKMKNGLLIKEISGLHAGTNGISGDFSLLAEGFKVENGKITTGVEQITIAGNFYEVLENIEIVADDLKFNSSAVGSPSVLIKELSVAGA